MLSSQMLLEIVLPWPVLGLVLALVHVAAIYDLVGLALFVDTPLMSLEVVVGAKSLGRLGAAREVAFPGSAVPCFVFPDQLASAAHPRLSGRITNFISEFVLTVALQVGQIWVFEFGLVEAFWFRASRFRDSSADMLPCGSPRWNRDMRLSVSALWSTSPP